MLTYGFSPTSGSFPTGVVYLCLPATEWASPGPTDRSPSEGSYLYAPRTKGQVLAPTVDFLVTEIIDALPEQCGQVWGPTHRIPSGESCFHSSQ